MIFIQWLPTLLNRAFWTPPQSEISMGLLLPFHLKVGIPKPNTNNRIRPIFHKNVLFSWLMCQKAPCSGPANPPVFGMPFSPCGTTFFPQKSLEHPVKQVSHLRFTTCHQLLTNYLISTSKVVRSVIRLNRMEVHCPVQVNQLQVQSKFFQRYKPLHWSRLRQQMGSG